MFAILQLLDSKNRVLKYEVKNLDEIQRLNFVGLFFELIVEIEYIARFDCVNTRL